MNTNELSNIEWLESQIQDIERLYNLCKEHPTMGPSLYNRLEVFKKRLLNIKTKKGTITNAKIRR